MKHAVIHKQKGVALVITLMVLVIVSLLSMSSIRTTTLQERMSANVLDREITFQTAESILRIAENAVANNPNFVLHGGSDCSSTSADLCPQVPVAGWQNIADDVPNSGFLIGTAQYHVAFLGQSPEPNTEDLGQEQSANSKQYGGELASGTPVSNVYRITVRNADPTATGGRSYVMLQSTIRIRQ